MNESPALDLLSRDLRRWKPIEPAVQTERWGELYDEHWPLVYRLVRAFGGSEIDAEDAAQDVFIALIEGLARFQGRAQLRTWIYRICLNVASEHQRRTRRRTKLAAAAAQMAFWRTGPPTPATQLELRHELAQVHWVLARLSQKKREVFLLCRLDGLSSEEAAEVLRVPEATVRTRLHHARKEFAQRFARQGGTR